MAKDAKGHGSNTRGGKAQVSVDPSKLGYRIADIGAGGAEHNVQTGGAWAAHQLARGNPHAVPPPVHAGASGRNDYNPQAVNNAIASSNRAGRRIGGKEASAIHRLLKGRH